MAKKVTLTFAESDPIQMIAYEYLDSQKRGKTQFVTKLINEHIARNSVVDELKIQIIGEIMNDDLLVEAIKKSMAAEDGQISEEKPQKAKNEEKQQGDGGLDIGFLLAGASQFAMQ